MLGLSVFGLYMVFVVFLLFMMVCVAIYLSTTPYPEIMRYDQEKTFYTSKSKKQKKEFPFGKFKSQDSVKLSVIVPAYNEEERLPSMMREALDHLEARRAADDTFSYEVIVVDDGSRDSTSDLALQYTEQYGAERVRVLTLARNRGKGGAIRMGMLSSRGHWLLFADADGATRFSDLDQLEAQLAPLAERPDTAALVCGSRAHLEKESIAQRSLFRTVLMKGFHVVVRVFTVRDVRDTQCGFKLFTRPAMLLCFANLHVERWAFDAEMLYVAQKLDMPIKEVAVHWTEIEGSKLTPIISWIEMGVDLFFIWFRYSIGAWRIRDQLDSKKFE
ncbi:dolichyl-phosphate beta-glucosyltransferase-like [Pollicipes pollicipes]|uniref:dolichyl-phosphate beta-glucosyltransferase-like n=1 Tax=Pollicipes pollicipes TaxID=41117 RepID=UPI001884B308|nr:dolichyl-phosphate beta-glucosyltransferase-like [Pollicipes pollicipes]XP_037069889.1 dolichyl-phosphate beta-glucosyltransferase-like [Pollicipes pollicipes]XP_037069890.1 dolichyl-phosphate beta-glucosyltransferase-like [Pollicipes pollicipes]XP_037069891.1 dolichyl-phosphate beta-glucosyltransferase-like [Pollicipes pollicipes]XP_037069892.1 dolichyl-phosphate beta-glucosyltransferase-like [Pollicipes pollicipes]XP_037069893.1 dolichyl-phosphate beta-glucosyltransferase-like [Pollicipes